MKYSKCPKCGKSGVRTKTIITRDYKTNKPKELIKSKQCKYCKWVG